MPDFLVLVQASILFLLMELFLQQEINKSNLENANKLSKNEIQTLSNRISLLEKENYILDQNILKRC
jgi:hypothetical protein